MLNRATPKRLTLVVLALVLGILLGLALFPSGDVTGAAQSGICDSVTQIPLGDCLALEAIYNSTDGAAWVMNTGWLSTAEPCSSWFGVTCSGGRVWQIVLINNGLNGPLPPAIGDLGGLQILRLGQNQLNGPIPAELGKLAKLTRLDLSSNQLSGAIPTEFGTLTSLRDLSLAYNNLEGQIPAEVGNIPGLQIVELLSNTLDGPLPGEFGSLIQLEWLDVSQNTITGTIPTELGSADNLGSLFIQSNQFEGTVPAALCDSLQEATLAYNMLDAAATDSCIDDVVIGNWEQTQTLPPGDLVAQSAAPGEVELTWTPVPQLADQGYYEIIYATTTGGPYTVHGSTKDKQASTYQITGLDPNEALFFAVRTVTPGHGQNQSDLISPPSQEAPITPTAITLSFFTASEAVPPLSLPLIGLAIAVMATLTLFLLHPKRR